MRILAVAAAVFVCVASSHGDDKALTWERAAGGGEGRTFTLVPIADATDKQPDVAAIWTDLLPGMAKDAETQTLLKQLLDCQTVEVAALPKRPDEEFRPAAPKGKSQVYIGVHLAEGKPGKGELAGSVRRGATVVIFQVRPTRDWVDKATPLNAFLIAANDYLDRTKSGCHLHLGSGLSTAAQLDDVDKRIRDPKKRREYIADETKSFLDRYKK